MTDLAQNRPVYLFCHVPKCAGTTVKRHMEINAPERAARAKRRHGLLRDFGGDFTDLDRSALDTERTDFVGGHSLSKSVADAFPGRPIRSCVLIRDPLSFVVSFYNHRNRGAARVGRGPVSLDTYAKSLPKNPISRFLLTRYLGIGYPKILTYDSWQRFEAVDAMLSDFWFVGSWLHASELLTRLSAELNIPDNIEVKNVASGNILPITDVPEEFARRIRSENAVDHALFERWSEAKWSGEPREIDIDLPTGDQLSYVSNEIGRQVMNRVIKMIRPRL
jgi:hypothetical protein